MLAQVLERVIAFAAKSEAQLVRAREEWAKEGGRVFDDDPLYEERTTAFLEWYALERPENGRSFVERFLAEERLGDLDGRWLHALSRTHRSLFAVRQHRRGHYVLDDLCGGGLFEVSERRRLPGVVEDDLFEARLVADVVSPPSLLFTRAFQFYPAEAHEAILNQAARARREGESRTALLFRLMRLKLKAAQYGHVAAARIYSESEE
jgi:hypothetical protein